MNWTDAESSGAALMKAPPPHGGFSMLEVEIEEIIKAYEQNEAKANKKYANQQVLLTGVPFYVGESNDGRPMVMFRSDHANTTLSAFFSKKDKAVVKKLESGTALTIEGLCIEKPLGSSVHLTGCRIVKGPARERRKREPLFVLPLDQKQFTRIVRDHATFIRSGGAGGRWETLFVEEGSPVFGIYVGAPARTKGKQANLNNYDLRELPLRAIELAFAQLCGVKCTDQDLQEADLTGALLVDSDFSGSDFRGARLVGADLSRCVLSGCRFAGADLTDADLEGALLKGADFEGALLNGVRNGPRALVRTGARPRAAVSAARQPADSRRGARAKKRQDPGRAGGGRRRS